jgi:hypothetical protein
VRTLLPEKNSYVIIPGKNWKLSLAELMTFLKTGGINFNITDISKSFFTLTSEPTLDPNIVDSLGGTIKLGRILSQIPTETVEHAFLHKNEQALKDAKSMGAEILGGQIFGIAGLLVARGKLRGFKGFCILAETTGFAGLTAALSPAAPATP